ncbi:Hypothetical protein, putative [Bodo saltans]|uniref:WW domain-containing protein n=1 Tax=Bodo saltans TaxID=75058 RepID=A0A0S4J2I7_BODSA|nr:Hypothetical protein, putative [Bodo saltans]|eukprot:CUG68546.1 Hypothetical protein, putative [Bodo saltans]
MATVPKEIVAGNTTYGHFPERHHDAYAPTSMLPPIATGDPPPTHTWRYCVAKAQGNTVYFSNKATGAVVWVLPDLAPIDGSIVVMKTVGTVDSALRRAQRHAGVALSAAGTSAAAADPGNSSTASSVEAPPPATATVPAAQPTAAAATSSVESPTSITSGLKSIQDKLQESIRQRLAARGIQRSTSPSTTIIGTSVPTTVVDTPAATAVSPPQPQPAHGTAAAALPHDTPPPIVTDTAAPSSAIVSSTSPGGGGVRDRIAQWRAGKGGPRMSRSTTPQQSITPVSESPSGGRTRESSQQPSLVVARVERDAAEEPTGDDPSPKKPLHRPTPQRSSMSGAKQETSSQQETDTMQRDVYEEKRRQMLMADEALQREKAELLRTERLAVERAQLAAETRAREEENYARIVSERRRMEEERLALEQRDRQRVMDMIARAEVDRMREAAAHAVDAFALADEDAKKREEAARNRATSFAEAITQSLIDDVAQDRRQQHKSAAGQQQAHHQHAARSSSSSSDEGAPLDAQHRYTIAGLNSSSSVHPTKSVATIQYTPQLKYMGHIGGGPTVTAAARGAAYANALGTSASLSNRSTNKALLQTSTDQRQHNQLTLQRSGVGTYVYDAPQNTVRYDGKWKHDKKHGQGDMSTSNVVYEGRWRDDKIHGKGMLQTKNIKASLTTRDGAAHGNAIVQTTSGSSFMGRIEKNVVSSPGALSLGNGDHVEWKWADPRARGTGECRIQFHNGDSYVGSVDQYLLHGKGAYLSMDGDEYIGDFTRGAMEGASGFFRFANGNTYEGGMSSGLFHGIGVYYSVNEYVYEGEWVEGQMHGKGRVTYKNGDVWEGSFDHDARRQGRYVASTAFQLPLAS